MSFPALPMNSHSPVAPYLWRIWAKWPRPGTERRYHPLLCHMLDVAFVTRLMWPRALTATQRARIADSLALDERDAEAWIMFWAGLHDLGKASPAFQTQLRNKNEPDGQMIEAWLVETGLNIRGARWAPHGAISLILIEDLLFNAHGYGETLTKQVAAIVGAHHGLFFTNLQLEEFSRSDLKGDSSWEPTQQALAAHLATALGGLPKRIPQGPLSNGDAMALAGLISVADWIGSNAYHFRLAADAIPSPAPLDLAKYAAMAAKRAQEALADVVWDRINLAGQPRDFGQLFPEIPAPRAVQQTVIEIAGQLDGPGLVIVEVPMGEGKTAAAMYLADHWSVRLGQRGAYFALPTQATSNQMFRRVREFLDGRFADRGFVNLHLAHGMAALSEQYERLQIEARNVAQASLYDQDISAQEDDPERGAVIAAEWFAASKRTLLSAYGVGTVDQALLAVLQVKHGFVRLFGLGGKTVIVDEVHAYDAYMSTLLESLLEWLGALGAPVVLLSATLPAARRRKLLEYYAKGAGWPMPAFDDASYPRVTYVTARDAASLAVPSTAKARTLSLRWVNGALPAKDADFPLASALVAALSEGGCAAVVCNTVCRAQQVYRALEAAFARLPESERPDLRLLHAQFRHKDRQQREEFVLGAFGLTPDGKRNPNRPHRAVLVATQVIEQSLDLDFDLMVTDLAPVDLLLQRAGRVHRHEVNNPRPQRLKEPALWVCRPEADEDSLPAFDRSDKYVYAEYILLRTWYELSAIVGDEVGRLAIPGHVERLIEAVYTEGLSIPAAASETLADRLHRAWGAMKNPQDQAVGRAKAVLIPSPGDDGLYTKFNQQLEEDNPEAHESLQARTRDGDLSLPVVLLDARSPLARRSKQPDLPEARKLLGNSVNLSQQGLVRALLERETVPSGWARTPWLRNHRLILLDAEGKATFDSANGKHTYTLTLDPTLGVIIESRRKEV